MRRFLVWIGTVAVAIAAVGCTRESTSPVAPDDPDTPETHGHLIYSSSGTSLHSLAWSSHTDRIYCVDGTRLLEIDPASGAVRTLSDQSAFAVMAPNGRALYYADRASRYLTEVVRFDLETEQVTPVANASHGLPVVSNRDDLVAYARHQDYALVIATTTGSNPEVVAPRGYPLTFAPDGRQILYSLYPTYAGSIQVPWRVLDLDAGSVREVACDVPGTRLGDPHWSAAGIAIASVVPAEGLVTLWLRTGILDQPIVSVSDIIDDQSASWSPDGARFAFLTYTAYTASDRRLTAWMVELATSRVHQVAQGLDPLPAPDPIAPSLLPSNEATLSPDGRNLAYTSAGRIFVASMD
jgi:hypothetical protein